MSLELFAASDGERRRTVSGGYRTGHTWETGRRGTEPGGGGGGIRNHPPSSPPLRSTRRLRRRVPDGCALVGTPFREGGGA